MIRKLWVPIVLLGFAHTSWADRAPLQQKTIPTFTLTDVVAIAIRNNPTLQQAKLSRITQKLALMQQENAFDPQYTLTANYGYTNTNDGETYTRGGGVTAGASIINHYGTKFSVSSANPWDYDEPHQEVLNPFTTASYTPSVTFTVTQQLLKGFGRAVVDAQLNAAKDTELTNKLAFQAAVVTAIDTAINDYFNLIQAELTLQVDMQTEKNYQKTETNDELYIKAGQKARTDIIQSQATLASQKVTVADDRNSVNTNKQTLLTDLGIRSDFQFNLPTDLRAEIKKDQHILTGGKEYPDLQQSQQYALRNNIDYQTAVYTLRGLARTLMTTKNANLPELTLTLSRIQGGQRDGQTGISSVFHGNNSKDSAQLNLTVPVDSFANKQSLINAEVALENGVTTFNQAKTTLYSTVQQDLETIKSEQEQVRLSEKALALQQENVNVAQKLHQVGQTSTFELITKQQSLLTSQTSFITTEISYLQELVSFNQELNLTLKRWNIKIGY